MSLRYPIGSDDEAFHVLHDLSTYVTWLNIRM